MNRVLPAIAALAFTTVPSLATEKVRVAVCQMRVEDGRVSENLARTEAFLRKSKDAGAKICIFTELIDVGFGPIVKSTSQARLAAPIPGSTADRLAAIATAYDVWIVTALLEEVAGGAYDTGVIIDNRGSQGKAQPASGRRGRPGLRRLPRSQGRAGRGLPRRSSFRFQSHGRMDCVAKSRGTRGCAFWGQIRTPHDGDLQDAG